MYGNACPPSFLALNAKLMTAFISWPGRLIEGTATYPPPAIRESVRWHQLSTTPFWLPQFCPPLKNSNVNGSIARSYQEYEPLLSAHRSTRNVLPRVMFVQL